MPHHTTQPPLSTPVIQDAILLGKFYCVAYNSYGDVESGVGSELESEV